MRKAVFEADEVQGDQDVLDMFKTKKPEKETKVTEKKEETKNPDPKRDENKKPEVKKEEAQKKAPAKK